MKLEGSLDAFSLPDVFQLLSYTKKTGGLHLAQDGLDGVVFFSGGEVTGASADGSRHPLARRLIGAGSVDDETLRSAVERVAGTEGLGLARALLESGAVDAELLRQAAHDQSVDAVFDLLRWREGDFAFVLDEPNPDEVAFSAPAADVLASAEGRRETWETVSRVVPSPDVVLSMPVVLTADPAVSRDEWALLALVDGRRTVAELVDLAGCGQYAVVSTLASLVERGLLVLSPADEDHASVVARRQTLLAPLERTFVPVLGPVLPAQPERAEETVPVTEPVVEPEPVHAAPAEVTDETGSARPDQPSEESGRPDHEDGPTQYPAPVLVGAHVPVDVVPPRPEPFLPRRQAEYSEGDGPLASPVYALAADNGPGAPSAQLAASSGEVIGATAVAVDPNAPIERDPSVNRSLMLRLIAGVRGL